LRGRVPRAREPEERPRHPVPPGEVGRGRETDTAELPENGEEVASLLELWAAIDLLSGAVVTLKRGKEATKTTWGEGALDVAARVVAASDYADGKVVTSGWKTRQDVGVLEAAKNFEEAGVVNLLATAVGRDGMGTGPDLATMKALCASRRLRVIASGGIRDVD